VNYLPRKKTIKNVSEESIVETEGNTPLPELPSEDINEDVRLTEPMPTVETVKVKVLINTLRFEQGTFNKGDIFEVPKERANLFDPKDIEILR